jgi:hypothetical protein
MLPCVLDASEVPLMSSLSTWAVLVASLATSDCHYRAPDLSWAEIKALAPFWRPRIPAPRPRAGHAKRAASTVSRPHLHPVSPVNRQSTGPAASIAPLNAPHKPTPDYGSPEWERQEAQNRARERAIDRTIRRGICRGC